MNSSGMITTLALALAKTGIFFPIFLSPVLGWLGVFITGSDTSSQCFFIRTLQQVSAQSVGMHPLLALAANSSGGVTGKMFLRNPLPWLVRLQG